MMRVEPEAAGPEGRTKVTLAQEQKMDVIGQFAAKVAHDFNNVLTAIVGYGNLFLIKMAPDDPLRAYAEQILRASERGAQITQGLLAFGSKQPLNIRPADLNGIIRRAVGNFSVHLREGIEVTLTLWPGPLDIIADTELIEQMMTNLASNACDAMPKGGRLMVRTARATHNGDPSAPEEGDADPSYAVISVEDTGCGMDQATLNRIFEPLFTTKPKGKGLGLGLSVTYGITKQHGGTIRVASEVGKGTVVRVYLPLIKTAAPESAAGMQFSPDHGDRSNLNPQSDS